MRRLLLLSWLAGAAAAASPRVQAAPPQVLLGRDHEVRLEVQGAEQLRWRTSEGELHQLDAHHLVWRVPDSGAPRTALLLLWDASDAPPEPTAIRIPLIGRTELQVDTEPLATVTVELAGRSFGPRTANVSGRVKVPVEVPPGSETATVHAESNGRATERRVALGTPPDVHVVAALSPHPLDPDQGGWLMVAGVPPLSSKQVRLNATGAQLQVEGGVDPLRYEVKPLPDAEEVAVTAERLGAPTSRTMTAAAVGVPPPSAPCPASPPPKVYAAAAAGGFRGMGAAIGVEGALRAGVVWGERVGLELEVGLRHTGLTQLTELGTLHSSINVLPVLLSVRGVVLAAEPWRLALRAGMGPAPYEHRLSATFQAPFREGGLTWQVAGDAEGAYRIGRWEPFVELGYAYSPRIQTPQVDARLGGPRLLAGVRGWLP